MLPLTGFLAFYLLKEIIVYMDTYCLFEMQRYE